MKPNPHLGVRLQCFGKVGRLLDSKRAYGMTILGKYVFWADTDPGGQSGVIVGHHGRGFYVAFVIECLEVHGLSIAVLAALVCQPVALAEAGFALIPLTKASQHS
jgi:poly-beta-hydroxyalkanoate depolymerase